MNESTNFLERAEQFLALLDASARLGKRLGYGNDGEIWATTTNAAVKIFEREPNYRRELNCYRRLYDKSVDKIEGFSVPVLLANDDQLLAIAMTIVAPPYLLDFGKAYLDARPDFSAEVIAEWEAERAELFEPGQWQQVQTLLRSLQGLGIYYYDAKPANICFG